MGKFYDYGGYYFAVNNYGPDTVGLNDLAHGEENMHNQDYIRDTIKLKNWNDPKVASDRKYLVKKVGEQFMDFGFNVNEISEYFFKNNSEPSKRIAQDSDFLNKIKENKENILNGKDISMEFPRYKDNKKSNLHFSFALLIVIVISYLKYYSSTLVFQFSPTFKIGYTTSNGFFSYIVLFNFILYTILYFFSKKYSFFRKIGYYTSIEFYKDLFLKIKKKVNKPF